eukprot:3247481-Amphidinium_carterae.3
MDQSMCDVDDAVPISTAQDLLVKLSASRTSTATSSRIHPAIICFLDSSLRRITQLCSESVGLPPSASLVTNQP